MDDTFLTQLKADVEAAIESGVRKAIDSASRRDTAATGGGTLLTAREIARRLSVSRSEAYLLMTRGELPTVRIGRAVRVSERDLDEWIARNRT